MKLNYYVACIAAVTFMTACNKPQKLRPLPINNWTELESAIDLLDQAKDDFEQSRDITKSYSDEFMQKSVWAKSGYDFELSVAQCMIYEFVRNDMKVNMFCYQLLHGQGLDTYDGIQEAKTQGAITDNIYRLARSYLRNQENDDTVSAAERNSLLLGCIIACSERSGESNLDPANCQAHVEQCKQKKVETYLDDLVASSISGDICIWPVNAEYNNLPCAVSYIKEFRKQDLLSVKSVDQLKSELNIAKKYLDEVVQEKSDFKNISGYYRKLIDPFYDL